MSKIINRDFIIAGLVVLAAAAALYMGIKNMGLKTCADINLSAIADPENTLLMEVSNGGCLVIEAMPDKAPNHVARFKELTRQGFYDGIVFHRVIDGFMAQTGDPSGTGAGGSGQNIDAEFNDVAHERGIVSTARANDPNSADSQFFIMFQSSPHLDGQYTVWGRVIEGMSTVDAIQKGPAEQNGAVPPDVRDRIVSLKVVADLLAEKAG